MAPCIQQGGVGHCAGAGGPRQHRPSHMLGPEPGVCSCPTGLLSVDRKPTRGPNTRFSPSQASDKACGCHGP